MADFGDLKQKAKEAAETIADVSVEIYKKAEAKTRVLARTAKLQAENASDRNTVKKLYLKMGKQYYESHRLFPEPEFEQSCEEVTTLLGQIVKRKAEIEEIKAKSSEEDINDVEDLFEDDEDDEDDDVEDLEDEEEEE